MRHPDRMRGPGLCLLTFGTLGALAVAAAACDIIAFVDRDKIPGGSGGSTAASTSGSGGGTTASATGTAGTGGAACLQAADCPAGDDCTLPVCAGGRCRTSFADAGIPTSTQIAGDCQRSVCDGDGGTHLVEDDTDVPVDGDPCTLDVCTKGAPSNPPSASGSPCAVDGGSYCDGAGHCVACVTSAECAAGLTCTAGACAP